MYSVGICIYCSTVTGWFEEVHKFGFKARYIHPFMFRMDTGHYSQVTEYIWIERKR